MKAANLPQQRPPGAKLLVAGADGHISHRARADFPFLLGPGDLVIANDAATLPASLAGRHVPTGQEIEVRLAGRASLDGFGRFSALVFGAGDFHTRTEDRPVPPALKPGDRLAFGPLTSTVERLLGHPRLVLLAFGGAPENILEEISRRGRPIQYAHVPQPLSLWDVWTPIAGPPAAFEPPSAGFLLDWKMLSQLKARGANFATITHTAGISSTGDAGLDALLPFDEPYRITDTVARLIARARNGGRVIAIGTTVARALEHAASVSGGEVLPGERLATIKIGALTRLQVVDALVSGTHEPGTSHYELLRAFTGDDTLSRIDRELNLRDYRTHEFGDSVFLERAEGLARTEMLPYLTEDPCCLDI